MNNLTYIEVEFLIKHLENEKIGSEGYFLRERLLRGHWLPSYS